MLFQLLQYQPKPLNLRAFTFTRFGTISMRPTDIDPNDYQKQLQNKISLVKHAFENYQMPELETFESAAEHYRMRAEFRIWHEGDELYHVMFDQQTKEKYKVEYFPPASKLINDVMVDLTDLLKPNDLVRRKLFQIDYLSSLSGQIVVTLVYHKALDESWRLEMQKIRDQLRKSYEIDIIGRAKKLKVLLDKDYVIEQLPINDRTYLFKQVENSFTQPNAGVNSKMIEWALDVTRNSQGDLLELYCGLGNFSLPLAENFNKVLATEISKSSVAAAQANISLNGIENVTILRMSSEEFVQANRGDRLFRRLEGIDLADYECQTILVDPPRSGLDDATIDMVKDYQNIVYISCNPDTLKSNLNVLNCTHKVVRFALFDQFPYTHHAECGVYLQKI
ncbi:MAG: tRNA (uracil-5-)-methyltransferase [Paraglaciecola sp.]|jgi:tRNA (uracil-5-)-methyltransferase